MEYISDLLKNNLGLTFALCFASFYYFYYRWKTSYWSKFGIKGPEPWPIFGNTLSIIFGGVFLAEEKLIRKYGKVVGVYEMSKPKLYIAEPELIKAVCVKDFHIFPATILLEHSKPIEGKMLSISYGDNWKRLRTALSPTFTSGKLRRVTNLLFTSLEQGQAYLDSQIGPEKNSVCLKTFWAKYMFDVTGKFFFSSHMDAYSDKNSPVIKSMEFIVKPDLVAIASLFFLPSWVNRLHGRGVFPPGPLQVLQDVTQHVIKERQNSGLTGGKSDLVSNLLEISEKGDPENKLDHDDIVASCIIFFIAGFEVTSTTLTWVSWELALNPEVQDRLYQEVSDLKEVDYDTVMSLPYLDAVINETLRLHPPAPSTMRTAFSDYQLPGQEGIVPKGSMVTIPIYAIHRDPDYWNEPEVFDPERFMPENKDSIEPYTFMPFGAGPRLCIGNRFALLNVKFALATVIRNYRFYKTNETLTKPKLKFLDFNYSVRQFYIGVEKRQKSV